jgi:hypothetical protein
MACRKVKGFYIATFSRIILSLAASDSQEKSGVRDANLNAKCPRPNPKRFGVMTLGHFWERSFESSDLCLKGVFGQSNVFLEGRAKFRDNALNFRIRSCSEGFSDKFLDSGVGMGWHSLVGYPTKGISRYHKLLMVIVLPKILTGTDGQGIKLLARRALIVNRHMVFCRGR